MTPRALRAVVADGGPKGFRVTAYAEAEIPPPADGQDPKEAYGNAVTAFFAAHKLPRGTVVPSLPAASTTIRELILPFGSDEQLRKTVKFELESHASSLDVEQSIVDFVKLDQKEKQTFLLVFATEKKAVKARLDHLAAVKADPPSIDLDAAGILNAYLCGPAAAIPAFLALHVGREGSFLLHYSGGLKLIRVLPLAVTEPDFEAKASGEACRTLVRISGGHDFPPVLVSGDGDDLPGLAARIARDSGATAQPVDLFPEGMAIAGGDRARRSGGVALGLALKGLGLDKTGLDFRREEHRYERKTDQLKKAAAVLILMLNIFLVLVAKKSHDDLKQVRAKHTEMTQLSQKMFTDLFPGESAPPQPLTALSSRLAEWKESQGGGQHPIPTSALMYWALLFGKIQVQSKFWIENLVISASPGSTTVKLSGKADPAAEVERIWGGIKTEPAFKNAKPPTSALDKGLWRYDIDIPVASGEEASR